MDGTAVKTIFKRARTFSKPSLRVPKLTQSDFDLLRSPRALLLDLRPATAFAAAFIPGGVSLPYFYAPELLGLVRMTGRSVYLLADDSHAIAHAERFFDLLEPIVGWFPSTVVAEWRRAHGYTPSLEHIGPDTLAVRVSAWKTTVIDLRDSESFRRAHIRDSIRVPLEDLTGALTGLPHSTSLSILCETGERCSFAASLLWKGGYRKIAIVAGGFQAYLQDGLPLITAGIRAPATRRGNSELLS